MMFLMGPPSQRLRNYLGERNIIFFIDFLVVFLVSHVMQSKIQWLGVKNVLCLILSAAFLMRSLKKQSWSVRA